MSCGGCLRCCGSFCVILLVFFTVLSIPFVRSLYVQMIFGPLAPTTVPAGSGWLLLVLLGNVPKIPALGPIRWMDLAVIEGTQGTDSYTILSKQAFNGPGIMVAGVNLQVGAVGLGRVGHEAVKEFYYDPKGPREVSLCDIAPLANLSDPKTMRFFAPGTIPFALHLSTDDPRWWEMRDLWSATIPALTRHPPHVPDFELPPFPGMEAKFCDVVTRFDKYWSGTFWYGDPAAWVPKELDYAFKFNFFRQIFGVDLTEDEITDIRDWFGMIAGLNMGCNDECAAKGIAHQKVFIDAVMRGEWSKGFFREAEKRGLDGLKQLRSLVTAFIVAGSGSPGCLSTAFNTIDYLRSDKKLIPVYEKDPEAFIMEVLRLHHGGGTGASFWTTKETNWTLGNGLVVTEPKGAPAVALLWPAGHDPNIWGGPSKNPDYACKFMPGRENREKVISFMSEIGDIRKCPNMTGCVAAPRFCPGAELCQRLSRQLTSFYLKKCTGAHASKEEM